MSRTFTIKELNEKIDQLLKECESEDIEDGGINREYYAGMAKALNDLKLELNSPEPIVNVTEKIQESLNIIETNKILKDGL